MQFCEFGPLVKLVILRTIALRETFDNINSYFLILFLLFFKIILRRCSKCPSCIWKYYLRSIEFFTLSNITGLFLFWRPPPHFRARARVCVRAREREREREGGEER